MGRLHCGDRLIQKINRWQAFVGLSFLNPTFYDLSEAVKVFCVSSWDSDQQLVRIASKLLVSCTWTERLTTFYPLVFDQPNPACALRSR
jgi:hypothetical protein